jgi:hypothetical protein
MNKPVSTMSPQPLNRALELSDDFTDDRVTGTVIGSLATSGHKRLGADVEGVLSIDNGALRVAPLVDAGFGRIVLAYGPFPTRPGLAFAVYMLNGHNTAQAEPLPEPLRARMDRWFLGSETDSRWERMGRWLLSGRVRRTLHQFRRWKRAANGRVPLLDENLAVGWFPAVDIPDPRMMGNSFIMHALGPENGELWAGETASRTRSLRGVQNLPFYFVAIARAEGNVYYVSSVDGATGLAPYPWLTPVAVDQSPLTGEVYVGIHQSVLGQIGFRMDTRVHGVRVADIDGYESWCGGAHAADSLGVACADTGIVAEVGGEWAVWHCQVDQEIAGVAEPAVERLAVLDPGVPSGLICSLAESALAHPGRVGLICRCLDQLNHWRLELTNRTCTLVIVAGGVREAVASRDIPVPSNPSVRRLQIFDNGSRLMAYVDGEPLADAWIKDERLRDATKVGIFTGIPEHGTGIIRRFEAHPCKTRLPKVLDMGKPWLRTGTQVVIADDFSGAQGDLDGRVTPFGGKRWSRIIGKGFIDVTGAAAAQVRGSVKHPCPGRTAYGLDWPHPEFVDAEVTVTLPGKARGERQRSTSGFILYQDNDNYMIVNVWRSDAYAGGSISSFFKFDGFEDIYDAIWTNVDNRVYYGNSSRLRLCCDGERYLVFVNDEPVLYRAFRDVYSDMGRLRIHKVGLLANWEWGRDTGSRFEQFTLRV